MYDENNNVTNYLKAILGFVGITDVQFAYAKGIGLGAEAIEKAQRSARNKIDQIVAYSLITESPSSIKPF